MCQIGVFFVLNLHLNRTFSALLIFSTSYFVVTRILARSFANLNLFIIWIIQSKNKAKQLNFPQFKRSKMKSCSQFWSLFCSRKIHSWPISSSPLIECGHIFFCVKHTAHVRHQTIADYSLNANNTCTLASFLA